MKKIALTLIILLSIVPNVQSSDVTFTFGPANGYNITFEAVDQQSANIISYYSSSSPIKIQVNSVSNYPVKISVMNLETNKEYLIKSCSGGDCIAYMSGVAGEYNVRVEVAGNNWNLTWDLIKTQGYQFMKIEETKINWSESDKELVYQYYSYSSYPQPPSSDDVTNAISNLVSQYFSATPEQRTAIKNDVTSLVNIYFKYF